MIVQDLLSALIYQRENSIDGNVYWKTQIDLAYNSNKIEGSRLTHEQTRYIFETSTLSGENIPVDDVKETSNHFRMFDHMLDNLDKPLDVAVIQAYQRILKSGTKAAESKGFNLGGWKLIPNAVADVETTHPDQVDLEIKRLLTTYNDYVASGKEVTLTQIAAFHVAFETIHPFLDGNGRTGRIIMYQQCLQANIMPFIIFDEDRGRYYNGLSTWRRGDLEPLLGYFADCQNWYKEECEYLLTGKGNIKLEQAKLDYADMFAIDAPDGGNDGD
jgi:Fic family protein